jgi:tetratricopeptide (TPR) repeat protein
MSEKELYIASLGFCVLIALAIDNLGIKNAVKAGLIAVIVISHSSITFTRSLYYKDSVTYLEKAVEFAPDFDLPHYVLAGEYAEIEEYEKALIEYQKTVMLTDHSMAYNNMGNIYYLFGDFGSALDAWEKAIQSDPENSEPYYNIGLLMERKGSMQIALTYYRKFLSLAVSPPPEVVKRISELEAKNK